MIGIAVCALPGVALSVVLWTAFGHFGWSTPAAALAAGCIGSDIGVLIVAKLALDGYANRRTRPLEPKT